MPSRRRSCGKPSRRCRRRSGGRVRTHSQLVDGKRKFPSSSFEVKKVCLCDLTNNFRRFEMKRFILIVISCVFVVALTGRGSFAPTDSGMEGGQKGEMKQQGVKMEEGMMKQMMEKGQPMMKQMMGDRT